MIMPASQNLQLRDSLRFATPRYDAYGKIWVKGNTDFSKKITATML
jgi:hypothetical protein